MTPKTVNFMKMLGLTGYCHQSAKATVQPRKGLFGGHNTCSKTMVDLYQQEVSKDVNVEVLDADADADATVLAMNAWEDQFGVVAFNDVDVDAGAGELEGNLVQIELMDFEIIQLETN